MLNNEHLLCHLVAHISFETADSGSSIVRFAHLPATLPWVEQTAAGAAHPRPGAAALRCGRQDLLARQRAAHPAGPAGGYPEGARGAPQRWPLRRLRRGLAGVRGCAPTADRIPPEPRHDVPSAASISAFLHYANVNVRCDFGNFLECHRQQGARAVRRSEKVEVRAGLFHIGRG